MAVYVKCRSRGNTLAATSTAPVPDVLGRPRQRHSAFLCILANLVEYSTPLQDDRRSIFND